MVGEAGQPTRMPAAEGATPVIAQAPDRHVFEHFHLDWVDTLEDSGETGLNPAPKGHEAQHVRRF